MNNSFTINDLKKIYPEIDPNFNFGLVCIIQEIIEQLGAEVDIEEEGVKIIVKHNKIRYSPEYILDNAIKEYNIRLEV